MIGVGTTVSEIACRTVAASASISLAGSAGAESESVTIPADVQAGDLLVAYGASTSAAYGALPSGWTSTKNGSYGGVRHQMIHKIASGSEGGTTLTVISNTGTSLASGVIVLRPGVSYSTFAELEDNHGLGSGVGAKTLDVASNSASVPMLIVTGHWGRDNNITPSWTGISWDETVKLTDVPDLHMAYGFVDSSEASEAFTFAQTNGVSNAYLGALFNLA